MKTNAIKSVSVFGPRPNGQWEVAWMHRDGFQMRLWVSSYEAKERLVADILAGKADL